VAGALATGPGRPSKKHLRAWRPAGHTRPAARSRHYLRIQGRSDICLTVDLNFADAQVVEAGTAVKTVVAGVAAELIVAVTTPEVVVAVTTAEEVVEHAADEEVVARPAAEAVAAAAEESIVVGTAVEDVSAGTAEASAEHVVTALAVEGTREAIHGDPVVAVTGVDDDTVDAGP